MPDRTDPLIRALPEQDTRLLRLTTVSGWASLRLRVLADMLDGRGDTWFADQLREVAATLERSRTEEDADT